MREGVFAIKRDIASVVILFMLILLTNLLGMINLSTFYGFKLHFFQIGIFAAAAFGGPVGGLVAGGFGSIYSTIIMSNPYILIGNIILGVFTGLFYRVSGKMVVSVLLALLIQLPWLFFSDIVLMKMDVMVVVRIAVALIITDILWATAVKFGRSLLNNK